MNNLLFQLKDANYPYFWQDKLKIIQDQNFVVKRYPLKNWTSKEAVAIRNLF